MYTYPHCNKSGISLLRRSFIGTAFPATCKSCGKKIGVPYRKIMLSIVPLLIALVIKLSSAETPHENKFPATKAVASAIFLTLNNFMRLDFH